MPLAGFTCTNPIEYLSAGEVERIHAATLEVLAETGMTVAHPRSRRLLADAGCQVDEESGRVRFPPDLVQWAIDQCPPTFPLRARNPARSLLLGGQTVYLASFPGFKFIDLETDERRAATVEDLARMVRLCDALPLVHTLCQPVAHLGDRPPGVELEWVHATELRNTDKTIMGTAFGGSSTWLVRMVAAADRARHPRPLRRRPERVVRAVCEAAVGAGSRRLGAIASAPHHGIAAPWERRTPVRHGAC